MDWHVKKKIQDGCHFSRWPSFITQPKKDVQQLEWVGCVLYVNIITRLMSLSTFCFVSFRRCTCAFLIDILVESEQNGQWFVGPVWLGEVCCVSVHGNRKASMPSQQQAITCRCWYRIWDFGQKHWMFSATWLHIDIGTSNFIEVNIRQSIGRYLQRESSEVAQKL